MGGFNDGKLHCGVLLGQPLPATALKPDWAFCGSELGFVGPKLSLPGSRQAKMKSPPRGWALLEQ
jgi:hypothetical protein